MRRTLTLSLLASTAVACLVAGSFIARADETKTTKSSKTKEADEPKVKTGKLGRDWENLRDSLDEAFETMQTDAGLTPAPLADDHTWLRRVYLDLTGAPPSPKEISDFNPGEKDPGSRSSQRKRQSVVEQIMAKPAFREHLATWLSVAIVGRGNADFAGQNDGQFRIYLEESFKNDLPWNEIVYSLFAGENQSYSYINYLIQSNDMGYVAGSPARAFLGRQIQCAQCHDSKIDDTTQSDFEAWQAFFKTFVGERVVEDETRLFMHDDLRYSTVGDLQKKLDLQGDHKLPRYLDGREWETRDGRTLREALAEWISGEDNPWFAEMTVNRMMGYYLGVGFVNPVDDFNGLNEPTVPLILKVMGMDFEASDYDLEYLIKAIVTSRMYQRQSTTNYSNFDDRTYYSHQKVRELSPESVMASILKVLEIQPLSAAQITALTRPPVFGGGGGGGAGAARQVPPDPNAPENPGAYQVRLQNLIFTAWDGDQTTKTVDERGGNIARALMFMNADILPRNTETTLTKLLAEPMTAKARVTKLFTLVMGRRPSEGETQLLVDTVKEWSDGKLTDNTIYEDLFIALLCSPEFINRA